MAEVNVTWVQGAQFVSSGTGGHSIVLDAPAGRESWEGFKPSELLLAAVGGCTGVDVVEILHKKRQQISGLRITVTGRQQEELPHAFTDIDIHYAVRGHGVSVQAVQRAIELSQEKYCSVAATVRGVAAIHTSCTVVDEDQPREAAVGVPVDVATV
jgi:putative redox protein